MEKIKLNFEGPYHFESLEKYDLKNKRDIEGIYLWTIKQETSEYLIHYIGESSKTIQRQSEHLTELLGLNYGIFDPTYLKKGELMKIWKGMWRDKSQQRISNCINKYPNITKAVIS